MAQSVPTADVVAGSGEEGVPGRVYLGVYPHPVLPGQYPPSRTTWHPSRTCYSVGLEASWHPPGGHTGLLGRSLSALRTPNYVHFGHFITFPLSFIRFTTCHSKDRSPGPLDRSSSAHARMDGPLGRSLAASTLYMGFLDPFPTSFDHFSAIFRPFPAILQFLTGPPQTGQLTGLLGGWSKVDFQPFSCFLDTRSDIAIRLKSHCRNNVRSQPGVFATSLTMALWA